MYTSLRFILFALLLVKAKCISFESTDTDMINRLAEYLASDDCEDRKEITTEKTGITCECEVFSSEAVPTSVHKLKPSDIKVVGAIGDAMTVGNAAGSNSIKDTLTEYRGLSFSAGGEDTLETIVTLPNILKKFNSELKGFSTNGSIGFNVAEAGASISDLSCQAAELIDMMKADTSINYEEDWKMVTIFIGINDLCEYCLNDDKSAPNDMLMSMYEALELLLEEMPHAYINIVSTMNVYDLNKMSNQGSVCSTAYMKTCPCLAAGEVLVDHVNEVAVRFQELLDEMIGSGQYEKQDFAVVVQPFLQKQSADKTFDISLMASDCINLSKKGQAMFGVALWHSLFVGTNGKSTNLKSALHLTTSYSLEGHTLDCPGENQVFATSTNSDSSGSMSANSVNINAVDDSSSSSNAAVITISIVGGCVCVIAIISGFIIHRRVRQRKGYSEPDGQPMVSSNGYTKFT